MSLLAFCVAYFVPIVEGIRAPSSAPPAPLTRLEIPTLAFPQLAVPKPGPAAKRHSRASTIATPTRVRNAQPQARRQPARDRAQTVRRVPLVKSAYTLAPEANAPAAGKPKPDPFENVPVVEGGFGVAPPATTATASTPAAAPQEAPAQPAGESASVTSFEQNDGQYAYPAAKPATRFMAMRAADEPQATTEAATAPASDPAVATEEAPASEASAAEPAAATTDTEAAPAADPAAAVDAEAVSAPADAPAGAAAETTTEGAKQVEISSSLWKVDADGTATASARAGKALNHTLRFGKGSAALVESVGGAELVDSVGLANVSLVLIVGSDLDDVLTLDAAAGLPVPVSFEGGAGNDTLAGPAADATWTISGADAGSVGDVAFSSVENLAGAAGNEDTFVFQDGSSISGTIEGGGTGRDTIVLPEGLVFSAYSGIEGISIRAARGLATAAEAAPDVVGAAPALTRAGPGGDASSIGSGGSGEIAGDTSGALSSTSTADLSSSYDATALAAPTSELALAGATDVSAAPASGTSEATTASATTELSLDAPDTGTAAAPEAAALDTSASEPDSGGGLMLGTSSSSATGGGGSPELSASAAGGSVDAAASDVGPAPQEVSLPSLDPAAVPGSGPSPPDEQSDESADWLIALEPAGSAVSVSVSGGALIVGIGGQAFSRPL
ncbi:MAG TPA: hypothetical protein VGQ15_17070, partial [Gaiellaceae bacterium]|nr:hypothetical protein [Gaiellaceae bacterium]